MPAVLKEEAKKKRARKTPWTSEEDRKLVALAAAYHVDLIDWHTISQSFGPERCAKRCRERWVEYINPALSTAPFTAEEDAFIVKQQKLLGNNWKEIANLLTTSKRSPAVVKTRWHQVQRRAKPQHKAAAVSSAATHFAPSLTKKIPHKGDNNEEPPAKRQKYVSDAMPEAPNAVSASSPQNSLVPLLISALTEQCSAESYTSSIPMQVSACAPETSLCSQRPRQNSDVTDMETPRSGPEILTSSSVLAHWEQQQSDALALHYRELHNAWAAKMLANAYQKQQKQLAIPHADMPSADLMALTHWQQASVRYDHFGQWQPFYMQSVGMHSPLLSQQQPQVYQTTCDPKVTTSLPSVQSDASVRSMSHFTVGQRYGHRTYFRG